MRSIYNEKVKKKIIVAAIAVCLRDWYLLPNVLGSNLKSAEMHLGWGPCLFVRNQLDVILLPAFLKHWKLSFDARRHMAPLSHLTILMQNACACKKIPPQGRRQRRKEE